MNNMRKKELKYIKHLVQWGPSLKKQLFQSFKNYFMGEIVGKETYVGAEQQPFSTSKNFQLLAMTLGSHIFTFDSSLPYVPKTGERKIDSTIIIIINGKFHLSFCLSVICHICHWLLDIDVNSALDQWTDDENMNDHNHKCQLYPFKCTWCPADNLKGHIDSCHLLCLSFQTLSDNVAFLEQGEKSNATAA